MGSFKGGEMKKITVFLMLLLAVAVTSAYAHTPSDMKITFDPATKVLKLVIMHDVPDPALHYIGRVNVDLNGKEVINDKLSHQDNNTSETLSYTIPNAKPGDIITVYVRCSIIGRLKRKIKI
jgi:hypothetical protein